MPATAVSWPNAATFCWANVRRGFYELATLGLSPIASEALEHFAALYAPRNIRGRGADERRALRQQKSQSVVSALEPWLRAKLGRILGLEPALRRGTCSSEPKPEQ